MEMMIRSGSIDVQRVEDQRERGHTWGNRAERGESGTGKAKGRESGICRGRRRDGWIGGGRVGMSKGISPNEDKSKEKSDQDRWGGWI